MSLTAERGRIENEVGRAAELAALCCFITSEQPEWLVELREATPEEDHQGIDLVAELDVGPVNIQVKSSFFSARRWRERRSKKGAATFPVLVVERDMSEARIRSALRFLLKGQRNAMIAKALRGDE